MKIIQKKCPSCNGNLKLEEGQTEGRCPYCETDFIIDDEVIEIKHTVEVKDDYDYEIAVATLDKFKEYDKAKYMFRNLVSRYGHKKEIYIYLVRAITHDFTKKIYQMIDIKEMNTNFNKYSKLAKDSEVNKYKDKVREINSNYWLDRVIELSDNFNPNSKRIKVNEAKNSWDLFKDNADKVTLDKYKDKFNDFYVTALDIRIKRRKSKTIIFGGLFIVLFVIAVIFIFSQLNEKPKLRTSEIKYSNYINATRSYNIGLYLLENYFSNYDNIVETEYAFNKSTKKLYITLYLENFLKEEKYQFTLDVIDDLGPVFATNECSFNDGFKFDLYSCIKASDLTDGDISTSKIALDTSDCDFSEVGTCNVIATASDSDNNEVSANISVSIIKTELQISVKLKDDEIRVGETTSLSYAITPNVKNKKVHLEYDKTAVLIDDKYNIKALKKGTTAICVIPDYNTEQRACVNLNIKMKCKSSYTFEFSGSKQEKIVAEEDFCPGTYTFSTSVLNRSDHYNVVYHPATGYSSKYYSVWKDTPYLNDEGSKIAFEDGSYLEIDPGITKITLKK